MLDPDFPLYTAGVRRLYHFEFHRDQHLLTAEVRRTLDAYAAAAPARIAKGQLTDREARAQAATWLAMDADLQAQDRWMREGAGASHWSLADKLRELRAAGDVSWEAKVAELRREIELRRAGYPEEVKKGRLTRDQAKAQLERIEAVHDLFWRHGYGFDGTREELRELADVVQSASVAQFGAAPVPSTWNEHGRIDGPEQEKAA